MMSPFQMMDQVSKYSACGENAVKKSRMAESSVLLFLKKYPSERCVKNSLNVAPFNTLVHFLIISHASHTQ